MTSSVVEICYVLFDQTDLCNLQQPGRYPASDSASGKDFLLSENCYIGNQGTYIILEMTLQASWLHFCMYGCGAYLNEKHVYFISSAKTRNSRYHILCTLTSSHVSLRSIATSERQLWRVQLEPGGVGSTPNLLSTGNLKKNTPTMSHSAVHNYTAC